MIKLETTTNDDGLYVIGNVPAAAYELSVEKQGFKVAKQNINVEVAQRLTSAVSEFDAVFSDKF